MKRENIVGRAVRAELSQGGGEHVPGHHADEHAEQAQPAAPPDIQRHHDRERRAGEQQILPRGGRVLRACADESRRSRSTTSTRSTTARIPSSVLTPSAIRTAKRFHRSWS
jgi:hypothetical protein